MTPLVDGWEVACRWDLCPPVARERLPYLANSDFHQAPHLWAWKSLLDVEKRPQAVLSALRDGTGVGVTRLNAPATATEPSFGGALAPQPA